MMKPKPVSSSRGMRLRSVLGEDETAGPRGLFGCAVAARLRIESCFSVYGEYVTRSADCRWCACVLVLNKRAGLKRRLSSAHVETSVPKLWSETGGRLDLETDYYNAHNSKGKRTKQDPSCLACADGPASGGETAGSASCKANNAVSGSGTSVSSAVSAQVASLSLETSTGGGSLEAIIITPETEYEDIISKSYLKATLEVHAHQRHRPCFDSETGVRLDCEEDCAQSRTKAKCAKFDWDGSLGTDEFWGTAMCSKFPHQRS